MRLRLFRLIGIASGLWLGVTPLVAQPAADIGALQTEIRRVRDGQQSAGFDLDAAAKSIDDLLWYFKLQDASGRNSGGIIGWSHGGYPVSDLVQRMGYKSQGYRDTFAGFIGKQAVDNPAEYVKRSPYAHVAKLQTPLLVHTNTNDEDVNVLEVEHLIDSLKAAGKKFDYKIYDAAPGGHAFNRIDTALARQSRKEIYAFLATQLK